MLANKFCIPAAKCSSWNLAESFNFVLAPGKKRSV